jgi:hypothetical protein
MKAKVRDKRQVRVEPVFFLLPLFSSLSRGSMCECVGGKFLCCSCSGKILLARLLRIRLAFLWLLRRKKKYFGFLVAMEFYENVAQAFKHLF